MDKMKLQQMVEPCYEEFIKDESIVGFGGLLKSKGLTSKEEAFVRNLIYDKYGKEELISIYRKRLGVRSHKNRSLESYAISQDQRQRMIVGIKRSWENNISRREKNRKIIQKYCFPRAYSPNINVKRIKSRREGNGWKPHTVETRRLLSEKFKEKWKCGDYDNRVPTIQSTGQKELYSVLLQLGYDVIPEYRVNNKPFDCGVPSEKILFEFNGTYWHLDPRKFESHYWDKVRNTYARDIWDKDAKKALDAMNLGYKVIIIWQKDWEDVLDKKSFLIKKINERIM